MDPTYTEAVETLKTAITKYPILRQFDPQRRIFLCIDASAFEKVGYYGNNMEKIHSPSLMSAAGSQSTSYCLLSDIASLLTRICVRNPGYE